LSHRKSAPSERDITPWRPSATLSLSPEGLPSGTHSLTWSGTAFDCHGTGCTFRSADLGDVARHLATHQPAVGYRPAPVVIDRIGSADDRRL
jgi:hypothetical protein